MSNDFNGQQGDGFGRPSGPNFGNNGPQGQNPQGQNPQGQNPQWGGQPQQNPQQGAPQQGGPQGQQWGGTQGPQGQRPPQWGQQGQGAPQGQGMPQGPRPPQGAPGGPGAAGPGTTGLYGQQPGGPGGPHQPGEKKNKLPLIIGGAVAGVLALALIIGLFMRGGGDDDTTTTVPGGADTTAAANADKPSDAVKGYLDALAAGNAEGALAFADSDPADKTMLTSEVLAAAIKDTPITAINVPEVEEGYSYATVGASYKLGDRTINEDFSVTKSGDKWRLSDVAADIDFSYINKEGASILLNGTPLPADKVYLFPGSYTVSTDNKMLSWGNKNKIVVDSPASYPTTSDLELGLSSEGKSAVVKAAQSHLAKCLKVKSFAPANCGFALRKPKFKYQKNTISWRVKSGKNQIKSSKYRLDYDDPTTVTGSVFMVIEGRVKDTRGNGYHGSGYITKVTADISGESPKISFEG